MKNTTISLPRSAAEWGSERFKETLQHELTKVPPHHLPLEKGLSMGSHIEAVQQVMLLKDTTSNAGHRLRIGVFFTSVLAGCNCADDPTPQETNNEYLELELLFDPASATATLVGSGI